MGSLTRKSGPSDVKTALLINQTYNMHCSAIPLGSVRLNASGISLPSLQRYNHRQQRARGRATGRSTGRRRERCPFANDADEKEAAASRTRNLPAISPPRNTLVIGSMQDEDRPQTVLDPA